VWPAPGEFGRVTALEVTGHEPGSHALPAEHIGTENDQLIATVQVEQVNRLE
jgi:hypothetical protein